MSAKVIAAFLVLLPACLQVKPELSAGEDKSLDSRLDHAREAEQWRRFDANLEMLYRGRRSMKQDFLLPVKPVLGNDIQRIAWAMAEASERSTLASMIRSEASNDLTHCQNALDIARQQLDAARERSIEAGNARGIAVRALHRALLQGDVEANLKSVESLAEGRSNLYMNQLATLIKAVREGSSD